MRFYGILLPLPRNTGALFFGVFCMSRRNIINTIKRAWNEDVFYVRTTGVWIFGWVLPAVQFVGANLKRLSAPVSTAVLVLTLGAYVLFPTVANADMEYELMLPDGTTVALIIEKMKNDTRPYGRLPMAADAPARRTYTIPITAYTSEVGQTDDTPCITASGLDVCKRDEENVVAANFLPLGTRVRIPELYGSRVFYVEDRMNARYNYKMDIWMKQKADAKQFGVQYATIEVF